MNTNQQPEDNKPQQFKDGGYVKPPRYDEIKEKIRNRVLVPREDFMIVKMHDQRVNAFLSRRRRGYRSNQGNVSFGYNTGPR